MSGRNNTKRRPSNNQKPFSKGSKGGNSASRESSRRTTGTDTKHDHIIVNVSDSSREVRVDRPPAQRSTPRVNDGGDDLFSQINRQRRSNAAQGGRGRGRGSGGRSASRSSDSGRGRGGRSAPSGGGGRFRKDRENGRSSNDEKKGQIQSNWSNRQPAHNPWHQNESGNTTTSSAASDTTGADGQQASSHSSKPLSPHQTEIPIKPVLPDPPPTSEFRFDFESSEISEPAKAQSGSKPSAPESEPEVEPKQKLPEPEPILEADDEVESNYLKTVREVEATENGADLSYLQQSQEKESTDLSASKIGSWADIDSDSHSDSSASDSANGSSEPSPSSQSKSSDNRPMDPVQQKILEAAEKRGSVERNPAWDKFAAKAPPPPQRGGRASSGPPYSRGPPPARSSAGGGSRNGGKKRSSISGRGQADIAPDLRGQYPLQRVWTWWYSEKPKSKNQNWDEHAQVQISCTATAESFCRSVNAFLRPSQIDIGADYHIFVKGIMPTWEDSNNANGGRWIFCSNDSKLIDQIWDNVILAMVGEEVDEDDHICGAVYSRRKKGDKVAVWVREGARVNPGLTLGIGKRLLETVESVRHKSITFEFFPHPSNEEQHAPAPKRRSSSYQAASYLYNAANVKSEWQNLTGIADIGK